MVWFQCEDCGENLKKPKLINHFRACSAQQLSCIDCGIVFNQQSVQGHTQCVSEAEKYGPKNTGCIKKETMKSPSKEPNCDGMDISTGLSSRAPWSCSLCNVKATSQETLILHSQGKKHRLKVRAMFSKQSNGNLASKYVLEANESVSLVDRKVNVDGHKLSGSANNGSDTNDSHSPTRKNGFAGKVSVQLDNGPRQQKGADSAAHSEPHFASPNANDKEPIEKHQKRRKIDMEQEMPPSIVRREAECSCNQTKAIFSSMGAKLLKVELSDCDKHLDSRSKREQKKHRNGKDLVQQWSSLVKWKKIIRRALKTAPEGSLRIKRLCSSLRPAIMEVTQKFGFVVSRETLLRELEKQIQAHTMFSSDGKRVRLAVSDMQP